MRQHFYPKLAFIGMVKNKKFYLPYLLTCLGMVAMYYIVSFLSTNQTLADTPGGGQMQAILGFGCGVIAVFAFIFLFYTNSFLLRRRKKEFGLYNILGMNKKNLAHILAWECLFTALLALLGGIFCGMLFAKLGELLMVHILAGQTSFSFSIDPAVIGKTVLLFGVIFGVIFLNALRQIHLTNPIALLHSCLLYTSYL